MQLASVPKLLTCSARTAYENTGREGCLWGSRSGLPAVGQKLEDAFLRPSVCELAQHVCEVRQRRNVMLSARAHEAIKNGSASSGVCEPQNR